MPDIIINMDGLHTTPRGAVRIRRNLGLDTDDVMPICRKMIQSNAVHCIRRGKNYYVSCSDCIFTVNATSLTIITAHRTLFCFTLTDFLIK